MTYDWLAGLVLLVVVALVTRLGNVLAFKVPDLERMRVINREQDALKMAKARYRAVVKSSLRVGLVTNLAFFFVLAPFVITLEARPVWRYLADVVLVLLVFDFFYYLLIAFFFMEPAPWCASTLSTTSGMTRPIWMRCSCILLRPS